MKTSKKFFLLATLFCSCLSAFAETPQQVQAWYTDAVNRANANMADAERAYAANPTSPSAITNIQRQRNKHVQLLQQLNNQYQQRMQRAQNPTNAQPIPGPTYKQNTPQPVRRGITVRRPDQNPVQVKPKGPTTVADQVANVYREYIRNYEIVLNALRSIQDTQSAEVYMPWIITFDSVNPRQMTPTQKFNKALQQIKEMEQIEVNLKNRHTAAVINQAAQPYLGKVQELENAINDEVNRIIDYRFFQSKGCEREIRQNFGYDGSITTDPSGTYRGDQTIGELFDELIRS